MMSQRFDFADVYIDCKFKAQHTAALIFFPRMSLDTANSSPQSEAVNVIGDQLLCGQLPRSCVGSVTRLDR